ncbi:MAG: membrane dipeptidase [Verrucomicrobiales bacterium]|nr:membrane dipeptidase [Verrucomicrobiales bacterium]
MLFFDAHLDLSLNALEYNRDLRLPISELRQSEAGMTDLRGRGGSTVSFPEMRKGGVGICVATIIGGCMKPPLPIVSWSSPEQARAMTHAQMAWYRAMEAEGQLRQIRNRETLDLHLSEWSIGSENGPIGYILSLEGADSLRHLDDLEEAVLAHGLRALGPAHFGKGRYALGHNESGPLPDKGKDLIRKMSELNVILDVTHLCDGNFRDALDIHSGPVWASHHNSRTLVDNPRQLSDEQIKILAERNAVIGLSFDVWMTVPNWNRSESRHEDHDATLETLANHIDHISQLLGTSRHCGIGSDLDGGFGVDQCPSDFDTIADFAKLKKILGKRGYTSEDLEGICYSNFLNFLRRAWA